MIDKLKVGGIVYDVEFKELDAESGVQLGWCNYVKSKFEINNHNVSVQKQEQTIIHEMTHAIIHESGLGFGDDEERIVNHISLTLHQVLKDNDFSWLRNLESQNIVNRIVKESVEVD